jgi:hypothetical protein
LATARNTLRLAVESSSIESYLFFQDAPTIDVSGAWDVGKGLFHYLTAERNYAGGCDVEATEHEIEVKAWYYAKKCR